MFSSRKHIFGFLKTSSRRSRHADRVQCFRLWGPLAFTIALCLGLYAHPAIAQPKAPTPEAELGPEKYKLWKELLSRAAEALNGGRTVEAIAAWRAAYEIKPMYEVACDIGSTEWLVGNAVESAYFLSNCLRSMPKPETKSDEARKAALENTLKQAKAMVGTLQFVVDESGASIRVDGQLKGVSPIPDVFVTPGSHRIEIARPGFESEESTISVGKGETRMAIIKLKKMLPKPPKDDKPPPLAPKAIKGKPIATNASPIASSEACSSKLIKGGIAASVISGVFGGVLFYASKDPGERRVEIEKQLMLSDIERCTPETSEELCASWQKERRTEIIMRKFAIASVSVAGAAGLATLVYALLPKNKLTIRAGLDGAALKGTW